MPQQTMFSECQTPPPPAKRVQSAVTNFYSLQSYTVRTIAMEPKSDILRSPEELYTLLHEIYRDLDCDQEHFVLMSFAANNRLKSFKVIASGGMTCAMVDPKILFRNALLTGAASIAVSHNHPSGNLEPSPEDIKLTKTLCDGAQLLDITVLDHIIYTSHNGYTSLAEAGHVKHKK